MNRRPVLTAILALAMGSVLLSACRSSGTGGAAMTQAPPASSGPSAEISPEASPSSAAGSALPTEPMIALPPNALLAVEGGDAVAGELGSFGWLNAGSDSPWLPGAPIHVANGERFTLTLDEPVAVDTWTVSRSPSNQLGDALTGMAEGSGEPVAFDAPPSGSWSVSVNLLFADNLGGAAYYWLIDVD